MLFYLAEQNLPSHPSHLSSSKVHGNRRFVQIISAKDLLKFEWEIVLKAEQWLIIQNCENLNVEESEILTETLEKIYSTELRKANFKCFIILYPGKEMVSHNIFDSSTVITVDDSQLSFIDFIKYAYTSLGPSRIHSTLDSVNQRQCLYKLCCFHFSVFERQKYGIFGFANPFKISLANFECAVSLFATSLSHISSPSMEEIWKGVIQIAYFTSDFYDLQSLKIIAEWIFIGINKYDNQILNGIWLKDYSENFNIFRAQFDSMPKVKKHVLSGLNPSVVKIHQQQELQKIYLNIVEFEERENIRSEVQRKDKPNEMILCKPVIYPAEIGEIEKCVINEIQFLDETGFLPERKQLLKTLLSNAPIKRLSLFHFQKPEAIIETLKFIFSKRYKLPVEDVQVIGSLKKSKQLQDCIEITECILIGAGYDQSNNSLIETTKAFYKIPEIYIYPRRKMMKSATSLLFPLFCQSNLNFSKWNKIISIEIESTLPENHWILCGVKFITAENLQSLFPNFI
uniref:Uncharacterized protein n=1 Tax=Panagrolaimus sp. PS1159 TaxID=55785 RepID=A0AC35FG31_9BILA